MISSAAPTHFILLVILLPSLSFTYEVKNVTFVSNGSIIVGRLFVPSCNNGIFTRRPAITVLGPFGNVKEQSPLQYATRLAKEGFVTLIYDPRYSGESQGMPRRYESPAAKISDIQASLDFLEKQPEVDKNMMIGLGICQGTSEMIAATSKDQRIRLLITISGQYIYQENIVGFFSNGGPSLEARIKRGKEARKKFLESGIVDYTPVIDPVRKDVGLPYKEIYDWYHKWENISTWENRYTSMSDAEVWSFNVDEFAKKIHVPSLIVHGDMSDGGPKSAQHIFDQIPKDKDSKKLIIFPNVFHTRFYDDPIVIDKAISDVVQWLKALLKDSYPGAC